MLEPKPEPVTETTDAFANRLRKNFTHLRKWARREAVSCFRVYDQDIPEYAVAVDLYENRWAHVQEYAPPRSVDPDKARERLELILRDIPDALGILPVNVFLKTRQRQKGTAQYGKLAASAEFHEISEHPARLLVNFTDYLDTGLFLDHRPVRHWIRANSEGKRFLNLFAYTGSATVHAALGGARATTTIDMSQTYLDWARRNMALNNFTSGVHAFIHADCIKWLKTARGAYDLIFMDPPTFSNSKRMEDVLDVQRDHVFLIIAAARLLAPGGVLIFSNNYRGFKLDRPALSDFRIEDITAQTLPPDFARNKHIHVCYRISDETDRH